MLINIILPFTLLLTSLFTPTVSSKEELFTVKIYVTDDYSRNRTPPKYCGKVPIILAGHYLKSGDKIQLPKGSYEVTPVVRHDYWVEGYPTTLNLKSDTTFTITLYVVD